MDHMAKELAVSLLERFLSPTSRLCVGISGVPGAGKTTLSKHIQFHVNALFAVSHTDTQDPVAIVIPLDGWHLTRSRLDTFPDPKLAHDRRGAHWTFDGNGYVSFLERLRRPISAVNVTAPSFSHSLKDPIIDDVVVQPHHRIVIIEGLYVFLAIEPWIKAAKSLDERWFVTVDPEKGKERLCRRHVETGVANDWEEAVWRADNNDIPNGAFIEANMLSPTRFITIDEDSDLTALGQVDSNISPDP
ncbi:P-loop containing nucleoside triphosphate hydrolase protein [Hysterangium stoloniferum]|nr:P-loop containing nucleoside triphosphate hydrolase protein [Hysterangium stoloniferum]